MKKKIFTIVLWVVSVILILFSCCLLYTKVCYFDAVIVGSSMNETLNEGEIAECKKIEYEKNVKRGDIIIFERFKDDGTSYEVCKRVIGIPGDKVLLDDNKIYVNDKLLDEIYLTDDNKLELTNHGEKINYKFILGSDDYYVLGDNRMVSLDSRYYGSIKFSQIKGILKVVYAVSNCEDGCETIKNKKSIPWRFY
jgi:signal peptidase I